MTDRPNSPQQTIKDVPSSSSSAAAAAVAALGKDRNGVPSGFVLKLFQMVNGAPDEVISWVPSGDSFRISDLHRLENETLPIFFRHNRFQSLVRQLNFYNFRKVNRERTFWVYKHQLFHRDRPNELHLLRRRTCPGADGRKNRQVGNGGSSGRRQSLTDRKADDTDPGESSEKSIDDSTGDRKRKSFAEKAPKAAKVPKLGLCDGERAADKEEEFAFHVRAECAPDQKGAKAVTSNNTPETDQIFKTIVDLRKGTTNEFEDSKAPSVDVKPVLIEEEADKFTKSGPILAEAAESSCPLPVVPEHMRQPHKRHHPLLGPLTKSSDVDNETVSNAKKKRSEAAEQVLVVTKVARKLDELAAAAAMTHSGSRKGGRRGSGANSGSGGSSFPTQSPLLSSDTMRYNALTYDDEIDNDDKRNEMVITKPAFDGRTPSMDSTGISVVTDADDSEDDVTSSTIRGIVNSSSWSNLEAAAIPPTVLPPDLERTMLASAVQKLLIFSSPEHRREATAVGFCLNTSPKDPFLAEKSTHFMKSCAALGYEFLRYKFALNAIQAPIDHQLQVSTIQNLMLGTSGKLDAIRNFKVFIVNQVRAFVSDCAKVNRCGLESREKALIGRCAALWFDDVIHTM